MQHPFLLSRVLLQFNNPDTDLLEDISAAAFTPDGSLWLGSDEFCSIERLSPLAPCIYGDHQSFAIADFVELFNQEGEIDIEGMDWSEPYLWLTGSHSTKRKKAKGKKAKKDIERLTEIEVELNRYLLVRIPVFGKQPFKACAHPDHPDQKFTAACLQKTEQSNILIDALRSDPHLGHYIENQVPSKENGFDIEGLAVQGDRVFLGLRGPVLRGWAIILELEVEETSPGILTLKNIGPEGRPYRKHFFDLNGLGVRELCFYQQDLLILAGPTLHLEGAMEVFRWKQPLEAGGDTLANQESDYLESLFPLPFTIGHDHAEGLALLSCLGQPDGLMVVYDDPHPRRFVGDKELLVDVFRL